MNYRLTISGRGPALAMVALLSLALLFCLMNSCLLPHSHHGEAGDLDMLHGVCGPALTVAFLASNLMFVLMSWWLLTTPGVLSFRRLAAPSGPASEVRSPLVDRSSLSRL